MKKQYIINPSMVIQIPYAKPIEPHYCEQCHKDMGGEWILNPVCGKCCRANHKRVTGRK